ncbi:MAG: hypothetical protein QW818_03895 [Candidatus Aenigmatarchaeota archaeon]|nr:hypothetical protein [Candidatus Aenigmarchaeota archaeon]
MSQAEILDYLKKTGKGTIKDFIEHTGKSKTSVAISLMKLKRYGEIKRIGWTIVSGVKLALYALNEKKLVL